MAVSFDRDYSEWLSAPRHRLVGESGNSWYSYRDAARIQAAQRERERARAGRVPTPMPRHAEPCIQVGLVGGPAMLPDSAIGYWSAWPGSWDDSDGKPDLFRPKGGL